MVSLKNKTAVIIGAAGRGNMGQIIAKRFADEGAIAALTRKPSMEILANLWVSKRIDLKNGDLFDLVQQKPKVRTRQIRSSVNKWLALNTARKFLVAALGFAGGAGVERLAELSNDDDPNTAQAAIEALARVGGARAQVALRAHLDSDDPVQKLAALEGLERLEARLDVNELRPLLDDPLVRRPAVRLLGHSQDPEALDAVFEALGIPIEDP